MEEENAFEILKDYAKNHNIDFETNESYKRFYLATGDPSYASKFVSFLTESDCLFLAKDSYAAKAYSGSTFSGIYTTIDLDITFKCKIYRKDKLDFLFRWNRRKTGNKKIDSKLTICCNKKMLPENLFTDKDLLMFMELSEKIKPLFIIIENNYLPELLPLKDRMVLGLESNQWIYNTSDLDILIEKGTKLLVNLRQNFTNS